MGLRSYERDEYVISHWAREGVAGKWTWGDDIAGGMWHDANGNAPLYGVHGSGLAKCAAPEWRSRKRGGAGKGLRIGRGAIIQFSNRCKL